jgi:hypothetical protein
MTTREEDILAKLDQRIAAGGNWICVTSPSDRAVAKRMVEAKILDTEDGHTFTKYDPDYYAFINTLVDAFLSLNGYDLVESTEHAERCMGRALFDGQFGWNMSFKHHPAVWDAALAHQMAERYTRFVINAEDDR